MEIWSILSCGGTLFLPDEDIRLQPEALLAFFHRNALTHAYVPTVLVPEFVSLLQPEDLKLQYLFTAGEKLGPVNLNGIPYSLVDYYGPTEATIFATCNRVVCSSFNLRISVIANACFGLFRTP